jgi:YD repeat-containing protein
VGLPEPGARRGDQGLGTSQAATTTYAYDPTTLGLSFLTDPNGHTTNYTYDARRNQLTKTDALGRETLGNSVFCRECKDLRTVDVIDARPATKAERQGRKVKAR